MVFAKYSQPSDGCVIDLGLLLDDNAHCAVGNITAGMFFQLCY